MELKVGDYVRTKDGIGKIISELSNCYLTDNENQGQIFKFIPEEIKKENFNLIDLIEVGDIIVNKYNEKKVITRIIPQDICGDEILDYQHIFSDDVSNGEIEIFKEDIKSIVTHEQFEANAYKIEKE